MNKEEILKKPFGDVAISELIELFSSIKTRAMDPEMVDTTANENADIFDYGLA